MLSICTVLSALYGVSALQAMSDSAVGFSIEGGVE